MKVKIFCAVVLLCALLFVACKTQCADDSFDSNPAEDSRSSATQNYSPEYDKAYYDFEKRLYIVENAEPKEQYFYQNGGDLHGGTLSYSSVDEALKKSENDENSAGFFLFRAQKLSSKSICHMDAWISAAFAPCYTVTTVKILEIYENTKTYADFKVGDTVDVIEPYGFVPDFNKSFGSDAPIFRDSDIMHPITASETSYSFWEFIAKDDEYLIMVERPYYTDDLSVKLRCVPYLDTDKLEGIDYDTYVEIITKDDQSMRILPNFVKRLDKNEYLEDKNSGDPPSFLSNFRGTPYGPTSFHYELAELYMDAVEKYSIFD